MDDYRHRGVRRGVRCNSIYIPIWTIIDDEERRALTYTATIYIPIWTIIDP